MLADSMRNMKLLSVAFTLVLLLCSLGLQAQTEVPRDSMPDKKKRSEMATQKVLENLLKYAAERKYDSFGKIMGYMGRDPNRNLRSPINPNDPHERLDIENKCNFLAHWLSKSALHHAKKFRSVKGAYGDLFFWDVEFTLLNGKAKTFVFMFFEVDSRYLFCNVENA